MDIWKRLDYIGNSLSEFSYRDVRSLMKMACAITLPHVYRLGWNWCQLYHVQIVADLCCDIYKQKDSSVMINPLYSYLFIGNIVARKKKKEQAAKSRYRCWMRFTRRAFRTRRNTSIQPSKIKLEQTMNLFSARP